jgi:hypothetical protein
MMNDFIDKFYEYIRIDSEFATELPRIFQAPFFK